jgi:hypothetical protein
MIVASVTGQVLELTNPRSCMIAVTGPEPGTDGNPDAVRSAAGVSVNFTGLFVPAKTPKLIVDKLPPLPPPVMASEEVRSA